MAQPNLNAIMQWNSVPISDFGNLLKQQGFNFNKTASFEDHRVFTSHDGKVNIVLDRNDAKVYANGNNKTPVHAFSVIAATGIPQGNDKAFRTGQ